MPQKSKKVSQRTSQGGSKRTVQIIVETPAGSRNKYKFDKKTKRMKLSKVLPEGMIFPYDFGFIPNTEAEDGDPLDVLVLTDEPTFPACLLDVRVIGVIKANQKEGEKENRNDRLIAVAEQSVRYGQVRELGDLDPTLLKQIEEFFTNYQKVRNIEFTILAREGAQSALEKIDEAA
jgi:inorganic pyrophosphatase